MLGSRLLDPELRIDKNLPGEKNEIKNSTMKNSSLEVFGQSAVTLTMLAKS